MNWVEIALALVGGANLIMQLTIKNELLKLELRMQQRFLSKDDFSTWTKRSNYLPDFKEVHHARH
jgi:hypothetical protein